MFSLPRNPAVVPKLALFLCLSFLLAACSKTSAPAKQSEQNDGTSTNELGVSGNDADAAEPGIASDSNGNLYVVYVEHAEDKTADLYLQKFDPSLRRTGGKIRINPNPGTIKAWAGDAPTIVIAPDTTIFVGWTNRNAGGTDFMLSSSRDGGTSFSEPTKINDDAAPASHGMHSLAVAKNGNILAAWLDERNIVKPHAESLAAGAGSDDGFHAVKIEHKISAASAEGPEPNSEVFFASSSDGGKTFSRNQKVAQDVCPCCKTAVTTSGDGKIYLSWRQVLEGEFRHIAVASSTDGGKSFSSPAIVSDDRWQISACPVSGAAIDAGPDGELSVAWYTAGNAGQAGYYTGKTTDGGETFGPRLFVGGEGASGTPTIIDTNTGRVLVMAGQDEQVMFAKISDQGGAYDVQSKFLRGANPAGAFANGSVYIAVVRNENRMRSVWIAKR